jgi:hypothetical protein
MPYCKVKMGRKNPELTPVCWAVPKPVDAPNAVDVPNAGWLAPNRLCCCVVAVAPNRGCNKKIKIKIK